jgi:chromosome partitioning protein
VPELRCWDPSDPPPPLHEQLSALCGGADLVVVDLPPRHAEIVRAALMVADVVLLPSNGAAADVWSIAATARLVAEARKVRPSLDVRIVLNRIRSRTAIGRDARRVLASLGLPVLATELADRVAFQESMAAGTGPTVFAPTSAAAVEVRSLVDEIITPKGKRHA